MTRLPDAKEIETIRSKKESAIIAQDFEKAAALRDAEKQTQDKLERIVNEWREKDKEREVVVTGEDIIHILSKWTGVPLNRMEQSEHAKTGHHVQRAEVGGYRGEVAAVDVLDDRTLFSTRRLYLFDRLSGPIGPGSRGGIASFAYIRGADGLVLQFLSRLEC